MLKIKPFDWEYFTYSIGNVPTCQMKTALNPAVTWKGTTRFLIKQSCTITVDQTWKCTFFYISKMWRDIVLCALVQFLIACNPKNFFQSFIYLFTIHLVMLVQLRSNSGLCIMKGWWGEWSPISVNTLAVVSRKWSRLWNIIQTAGLRDISLTQDPLNTKQQCQQPGQKSQSQKW